MNPKCHLKRLHIQSPQASALANFYAQAFAMTCHEAKGTWFCQQEGREILISEGQAGKLHYALFEIQNSDDWADFVAQTSALPKLSMKAYPELPNSALGFMDPDQNCMVFVFGSELRAHGSLAHFEIKSELLPSAESQHFALRTKQVENMMSFPNELIGKYTDSEQGTLTISEKNMTYVSKDGSKQFNKNLGEEFILRAFNGSYVINIKENENWQVFLTKTSKVTLRRS
jgi:hypothetical protein